MFNFVLPIVVLAAAFFVVYMVLKARKPDNTTYKSAVYLAFAATLLIVGINLAVGIIGTEDNPANLMYMGVLAVGIIGAVIARFQPHGMVRAMFATAVALMLVAMIAVIAFVSPLSGTLEILGINGFFAALFVGSGLLFRKVAREQHPVGARSED